MSTIFCFIWFGSLIYFIILWRQKKSARLSAGPNYNNDETYQEISKKKRIVGIICVVSFFLIGVFSPSKNDTSRSSNVATTSTQETKQQKEAAAQEEKARKEAEKIEKEQREAAEKAERERQAEEKRIAREQEKIAKERAEIEGHDYKEININTMLNDLESNAARANRKYKGQYLKIVGGIVYNIESDGDYITIDIPGSYGLTSIQCFPKNKAVREHIFNLNSGQPITVYGKVSDVGEILGYSFDLLKME